MEILEQYVVAMVVAFCLCVGWVVKHTFDSVPNKYIPLILALLGCLINIFINSYSISVEIILGGMASGLAACGVFEAYTHLTTKKG